MHGRTFQHTHDPSPYGSVGTPGRTSLCGANIQTSGFSVKSLYYRPKCVFIAQVDVPVLKNILTLLIFHGCCRNL